MIDIRIKLRRRQEQRDRARAERDAAMLRIAELERERDELLAALEESLALNMNWTSEAEPDVLEYYSEYKAVIKQAKEAIAKAKGE